MTDVALWKRPFAFIGALSLTYHEVIRDRRTSTCLDCGRLGHATSETCLCGGELKENRHPDEVLSADD